MRDITVMFSHSLRSGLFIMGKLIGTQITITLLTRCYNTFKAEFRRKSPICLTVSIQKLTRLRDEMSGKGHYGNWPKKLRTQR